MPDTHVLKADTMRQLVFGWSSVAVTKDGQTIEDSHGDRIDPQDLEDAAYGFVLKFRDMNERHQDSVTGVLVESFVVTPEKLEKMGLPPGALPTGWWTGFYVADAAVFAKIMSGEYTIFSIEGSAVRTPTEGE